MTARFPLSAGPLRATTLAAALAVAPGVSAQEWTAVAGGEAGGDGITVLSTTGRVHAGGSGWSPFGNVTSFRVANEQDDTWSLIPGAGMTYGVPTGRAAVGVGYHFQGGAIGTPFFGGPGEGWVVFGEAMHWGTGELGGQALLSYNVGTEYLWSRGRVTRRSLDMGPAGQVHLGADYVYQGAFDDGRIPFRAHQAGPLVQWHSGQGVHLGVGGGWKRVSSLAQDTWYIGTEFVLIR